MKNKEIQLMKKIISSEGMKCVNRMKYHNNCISILQGNCAELSKKLLQFGDLKNALELMNQKNRAATEKYQNEINRLLHNFLASVMTLIDHTRIFMSKNYKGTRIYEKYKDKIKNEFITNGLSQFIKELRHYVLHRGLPYTGLALKENIETTVSLDRDAMLNWKSWSVLSRDFLASQPEKIRIFDFVNEYTQKVDALNTWINKATKEYHKKDLEELALLREEYKEKSKEVT
jgi:hypothetical protein